MQYLITEYDRLFQCCATDEKVSIIRIYAAVLDTDGVKEYLKKRITNYWANLSDEREDNFKPERDSQILEEMIKMILSRGSLHLDGEIDDCICGNYILIERVENLGRDDDYKDLTKDASRSVFDYLLRARKVLVLES